MTNFCFLFRFLIWSVLESDTVTCFGKKFFAQWGAFVEYYFIKGVIRQSVIYCFW